MSIFSPPGLWILAISIGAEYVYLMFHGALNNYQSAVVARESRQTSDSTYNYLQFPISLVGRIPLTQSIDLILRAGAFIGHFLGGRRPSATISNPSAGFPS